MHLIETQELELNLKNFKIIDCSWHMPQEGRDALKEYMHEHIPNSIFLILIKILNKRLTYLTCL